MPFESKSQLRACYAKNDPAWDCQEWADHTPSTKKLPEKKKATLDIAGLAKQAAGLPLTGGGANLPGLPAANKPPSPFGGGTTPSPFAGSAPTKSPFATNLGATAGSSVSGPAGSQPAAQAPWAPAATKPPAPSNATGAVAQPTPANGAPSTVAHTSAGSPPPPQPPLSQPLPADSDFSMPTNIPQVTAQNPEALGQMAAYQNYMNADQAPQTPATRTQYAPISSIANAPRAPGLPAPQNPQPAPNMDGLPRPPAAGESASMEQLGAQSAMAPARNRVPALSPGEMIPDDALAGDNRWYGGDKPPTAMEEFNRLAKEQARANRPYPQGYVPMPGDRAPQMSLPPASPPRMTADVLGQQAADLAAPSPADAKLPNAWSPSLPEVAQEDLNPVSDRPNMASLGQASADLSNKTQSFAAAKQHATNSQKLRDASAPDSFGGMNGIGDLWKGREDFLNQGTKPGDDPDFAAAMRAGNADFLRTPAGQKAMNDRQIAERNARIKGEVDQLAKGWEQNVPRNQHVTKNPLTGFDRKGLEVGDARYAQQAADRAAETANNEQLAAKMQKMPLSGSMMASADGSRQAWNEYKQKLIAARNSGQPVDVRWHGSATENEVSPGDIEAQSLKRDAMASKRQEAIARRSAELASRRAALRTKKMGSVEELAKEAAAFGGFPTRMIRDFAPVGERRNDLLPYEKEDLAKGESQWMPTIFQSDATPISEMLASPSRQGTMAGGLGAAAGGGLGYLADKAMGGSGVIGGLSGAALLGALSAAVQYKRRWKQNEHLEETMRRLPPNATKRDYAAHEMLSTALANRFGSETLE